MLFRLTVDYRKLEQEKEEMERQLLDEIQKHASK